MLGAAELTRQAAEDFLTDEADLLDERRYEEWLKLFTADGMYWIPLQDGRDPVMYPSIAYDNASLRAQRVHQVLYESRFAQSPPSRTLHTISNVRVQDSGRDGEAVVRCNLAIFELRPGLSRQLGLGEQRTFAARCEYHLRREENGWRMSLKRVLLLNRDLPIENLTFIL